MAINIHIENIYITPDVLKPPMDEQLPNETVTTGSEGLDQYGDIHGPETAEGRETQAPSSSDNQKQDKTIAERYTQDEISTTARVNFLRNVSRHASPARKLEGFQTNHQRRPRKLGAVNSKQHGEREMARESLERACGECALAPRCRIKGNIDAWLDIHPYAKGNASVRRPGSRLVKKTESRETFLKVLRDDPLAHCDPARRK